MKLARLVLLAAALVSPVALASSHLAPPEARQDPDFSKPASNAALLYLRTWMLEVDNSLRKVAEINWADPAFAITPEVTEALAANRGQVEGLLRAASAPDCDWGVDYDLGFEALLPHLSKLRSSARLLAVEARVKAIQGDPDAAAQRVAAILNMARHGSGDRLIIVSLVAQAIANLGADVTDVIRPSLTNTGREAILAAARQLDTPDAFGARAAIRGEGVMIQKWVKARCTGPDAGKKFVQLILPAVEGGENNASGEVQLKLGSADEATLHADLDKAIRVSNDALAIWDQPDAADRLKEIASRVETGQYGIAARAIAPAFTRYHTATQKALAKLQVLQASLKAPAPAKDEAPAKPAGK